MSEKERYVRWGWGGLLLAIIAMNLATITVCADRIARLTYRRPSGAAYA